MLGLLGCMTYPVWRVDNGRLLSIRASPPGADHLIMPCPEVLRITCAPHCLLTLALLAGPWELRAADVLNTRAIEAIDYGMNDPTWRVATVEGLEQGNTLVAANL